MFIYISPVGYITKQPLLINLMGMFAIIASTNILFFFIPIYRIADSLVYFIPPFIENIGFFVLSTCSSKKNNLLFYYGKLMFYHM